MLRRVLSVGLFKSVSDWSRISKVLRWACLPVYGGLVSSLIVFIDNWLGGCCCSGNPLNEISSWKLEFSTKYWCVYSNRSSFMARLWLNRCFIFCCVNTPCKSNLLLILLLTSFLLLFASILLASFLKSEMASNILLMSLMFCILIR